MTRRFQQYLLIILSIFFSSAVTGKLFAQVSPLSLLVNGDFESGLSGTGFQVPAPYVFLGTPPPLSGNSSPGDYAIIPNPQPMNTANFIAGTDHSGTGKMLVIDGNQVAGGPPFWKAGNTGGGVGPLTVGLTYTFSYWKKSISVTCVDAATSANIIVAWNNAGSIALISGTEQVSFPGSSSVWEQVVYRFVPTSPFVNIELYNTNTSLAGNDFAIDDLEVLAPPDALTLRYSLVPPSCPNSADGSISLYARGGTFPYTYSLNSGPFQNSPVFTGLSATGTYQAQVRDQLLNTAITPAGLTITAPDNPLSVQGPSTGCASQNLTLTASSTIPGQINWTANPPDPSLTTPNVSSPVVSPIQTTTYTANFTFTRNRNLIYNPDFSLGDLGFGTDYQFLSTNPTGLQTTYGITQDPSLFESGFTSACRDHTSGTGLMMVVDGAIVPNRVVWRQIIPVMANRSYSFGFWMQTLALPSVPAAVEVLVNGQPITGNSVSSTLTGGALCTWIQFTANWNSGASTTAEIQLINRIITGQGNDFALDDLFFSENQTCVVSQSHTVTISNAITPVTGFRYADTLVCPSSGSLQPIPDAGFTSGGIYRSAPGIQIDSVTGVINPALSNPGNYTITYQVNASGCQLAGSSQFRINIASSPLKPNLGPDLFICPGQVITLDAGTYDRYVWSNQSVSRTIAVNTAGLYDVTVFNTAGCSAKDSVRISNATACNNFYIPTAFTPNQDGLNDEFGAIGNLSLFQDYTLNVYNRFGQLVFSSFDPYIRWDGRFKGVPSNSQSFTWMLVYRLKGPRKPLQTLTGNVVLIR